MKLAGAGVESFLKSPTAAVRAVLLYGPDSGLVRERMNRLTVAVAGSTDDPFRVAEFAAATLRDDPARLADEAAALAMTGGRRVVRLRDADGEARLEATVAKAFESFFDHGIGDALVVVTAGDVGGRSALVRVFEAAEQGAAIACYLDDARTVEGLVRDGLKAAGLTPTPDALDYLVDRLGGDREVTRREIEKLALYVGKPGAVTEDDAIACVGDTAALALDDLVMAVGDGDQPVVQRVYGRLVDEGASPISIIGAAARHVMRLHETAARVAGGVALDQAMNALRPPPFFKVKPRFRAQAARWSAASALQALEVLTEAELRAKSTDMPAVAIVERALMQVASAGRAAMRGR
jgi:DNA polymerase-3 subunit delta